jgi:predicted DNA binding CopG/RHH family protein
MKYFELEQSEEDLLRDFEKGKFQSVRAVEKEKKVYQKIVDSVLKKAKNINIRLSEHDLLKLKAKALEEGLPYQTYLASLVHKHLKVR